MRQGKTLPGRISSRNGLPENKLILATSYSPTESAVPSAQESLTAVFGMGTGVASPLLSPGNLYSIFGYSDVCRLSQGESEEPSDCVKTIPQKKEKSLEKSNKKGDSEVG